MVAFVETPVVLSVYAYYKCMLTTFVPPWHNQSTELFSLVILGLQVHLPSPRDPFKYFEAYYGTFWKRCTQKYESDFSI